MGEFIEATFVPYLCGATSTMHRRPHLKFGPASKLDDAFSFLSGRSDFNPIRNYLSWTVDDTLNRSSLFFGAGDPFSGPLKARKLALEDAVIIRNRVAHSSQKARAAFRVVGRRLRHSQLQRTYSVGDLLLERVPPACAKDYQNETLFEAYLYTLRFTVDEIAGLPSAD